jgi:hypothetical protein
MVCRGYRPLAYQPDGSIEPFWFPHVSSGLAPDFALFPPAKGFDHYTSVRVSPKSAKSAARHFYQNGPTRGGRGVHESTTLRATTLSLLPTLEKAPRLTACMAKPFHFRRATGYDYEGSLLLVLESAAITPPARSK